MSISKPKRPTSGIPAEGETVAPPLRDAAAAHLRPSQCRNYTRRELAKALPTIVDTFVDRAGEGSVTHLHLLTKIGGFDLRPAAPPRKRRGKSGIRALLDDLRAHQARLIARNEPAAEHAIVDPAK